MSDVDQYEYMALVHERQDRNRTMLGLGAFLFLAFGLVLLGLASQKTETKKSGIIGFRKETIVPVPTETRVALLLGGVVLMLVAFSLALIAYRASRWHGALAGGDPVITGSRVPGSASHIVSGARSAATSASPKEFWIQTVIAVLGLIITAVSAAVAWFSG